MTSDVFAFAREFLATQISDSVCFHFRLFVTGTGTLGQSQERLS
jgi:hypothetical protein